MNDLAAARSQMAMSLAFHIVFASFGVSMPLLMAIVESLWMITGRPIYLVLAKRWAKGTAILVVVGALSGTVLSFELGLLWPHFMAFAGSVIGMPFSLEGLAFFAEAIALGIYLYAWGRISPGAHLAAGIVVAISGGISACFVTSVNGWMNTPVGFQMAGGTVVSVDPVRAMFNPAAIPEGIHMLVAAYCAVGFAVAGVHALLLLGRGRNLFHETALKVALALGISACFLQFLSGDALARMDARYEPAKLASFEGQFRTEPGAPLHIGGIPDPNTETMKFALRIPHGLSLLAFHDPDAVIHGLDDIPRNDWPNVTAVHLAFQTMVGCGALLAVFGAVTVWGTWRRKHWVADRRALLVTVLVSPIGFVALESGWAVTELGRQPWIIHGLMRTSGAVTPVSHLVWLFTAMSLLYVVLGVFVVWLMVGHVFQTPSLHEMRESD